MPPLHLSVADGGIKCFNKCHYVWITQRLFNVVQVCWVTNTYYVPEGSPIGFQPGAIKYHIGYYQWVPVMLLVQAFFFYAPCLVWRVFSERSGININNLVEAADTIQNALYPERREKTIK